MERFDLIVIGGGITGAGIAWEASLRGLNVLVADKGDFASGTSSKSTKLIHGGLRYLKEWQWKTVYYTGRERKQLHALFPHLIIPEPLIVPIMKGRFPGKWTLRCALAIYEWLAGVEKAESFTMLNKHQTLLLEPYLDEQNLLGAASYIEYRCDDARLVIEVLQAAKQNGSICLNYHEAKDFIYEKGKVIGARFENVLDKKQIDFFAPVIVNATGAAVDYLHRIGKSNAEQLVSPSRGAHLVVSAHLFPLQHNIYFPAIDGRMLFAIRRQSKVYIGTTDIPHSPDLPVEATHEEIDYLRLSINKFFKGIDLAYADVESTWAGLRPLINSKQADSTKKSRRHCMVISENGLITITGGKLTGFRRMAKQVVDQAMAQYRFGQKNKHHYASIEQPFGLSPFKNQDEILSFIEQQWGEAKQVVNQFTTVERWVWQYGKRTADVVETAFALWPEENNKEAVADRAEIRYCIRNEWVKKPEDFWIRRRPMLYFEKHQLIDHFQQHYSFFCKELGYDETTAQQYEYAFLNEIEKSIPGLP